MHLELGDIDVSSELEMGGHAVPNLSAFQVEISAYLVLDVLIKKIRPTSPGRNMTRPLWALYFVAGRGAGKPSQIQLDLGCGFLFI